MKIHKISFLNYFFTIFPFLFFNTIEAQKTNQELLQLINNKKTLLENKFQYLCDISINYADNDTIKAFEFVNRAMSIAKESKSLIKIVVAYDYLSSVARRTKNIKNQIRIVDECLFVAKDSKDLEIIAYCDYLKANKNYLIKDKEKYVYYVLKSLDYFEKNKKRYDKLVSAYAILGSGFMLSDNATLSEKYAAKCLRLGAESNNMILKSMGLNNWANHLIFKEMENQSVNKKIIDSVNKCYKKVIKILESKPEYLELGARDYSRSYTNLAAIYFQHFDLKIYNDTILGFLDKAEKINLKFHKMESMMSVYAIKSDYFIKIKKYDEAEKVLKKFEEYSKVKTQTDRNFDIQLYESHMEIAKSKNDFKSFLKYFDLYEKAKNIMHKKETNETIYNASIKFETEQKIKEIKSLTIIAEERKKINYLLIVLSILSFLTLIFMYKTFQFRKKTYKLSLKSKEDEAISTMPELEIANRERKIAIQEKLLTDQQKEKLQHELMTNNLQLENKKDILKDIQQKLSLIKSSELKSISRTINKSIEIDEEFELLKSSFENTNPEFFSILQGKSSNSLTKLDLKYCGYIKLGLGIKEMANIMNIEPKSMKMARYRLRQKLDLKKEEDLDDFVNSI